MLPSCWRTSISISSVISARRSSHWKRQAGWNPLSYILSACQQNGCALEDRTFWTYIQIKPTTLKSSLNKQYFFVVIIFPIGLGGGFHVYARTKNPRKSPYQWINPKNVTSIYKSTSQGIMLRNWGYTLFINVFSTFLFSKGSRWKKRGLVLFPASLLLTLLWGPIQISVPACLHNVHSNYVHRHYLCYLHLS